MCLGVPARIVEKHDDHGMPMAVVDFGGVTKSVCLAYTPDAEEGEYVVIHAGFAIALLDEDAAQASLDLFEQIGLIEPTQTMPNRGATP